LGFEDFDQQQCLPFRSGRGRRKKNRDNLFATVDKPNDPLISRLPYSPVIGPRRREMKAGITYRCQRCGETLTAMPYRVRGTIAEVCDVCAYPVESD
jgi:hypothetical protein